jgi:hypothetical protein
MRKYLRSTCSHGWIINVTPEGKQPPTRNAVFNIETPVAIALFLRAEGTNEDVPADVRYVDLHGTRAQKFKQLSELGLSGGQWRETRSGWTAPFVPPGVASWDEFPALDDLLPWRANGIMAGRGWVYGPSEDILEARVRDVINESDPAVKAKKFVDARDASLARGKSPLFGADVEQDTLTPFGKVVIAVNPKIVRVGYRSFDRQWLVADKRLLSQPSPSLWQGRIPGQVFMIELHSEYPKSGPAVVFSSLIPDVHHFRGSGGGRALPMLHPDGTPNVSPGLLEVLTAKLGVKVAGSDLTYYAAAVCAHPGFVTRFDDELHTPGVRIPVTAEGSLWTRAVDIGRIIVWLHTYGAHGSHPSGLSDVRDTALATKHPVYAVSVGNVMPEEIVYDAQNEALLLGAGKWSGVSPAVRAYEVGGANVIDSWAGYRFARPSGRRKSPLDDINVTSWPAAWSIELSELLSVLTQLVGLEQEQGVLLTEILDGRVLSREDLESNGVTWPKSDTDTLRKPRLLPPDGMFGSD